MSDSDIINKIDNLLRTKELKIVNDSVWITDKEALINFSISPEGLEIKYPTIIPAKDIKVNPGEVDRLYQTVERIKWGYLIDLLNNNAWQSTLYKPNNIDAAEKALVNFVEKYNRIKIGTPESRGMWNSGNPYHSCTDKIRWENDAGFIEFMIFRGERRVVEKKFLRKKTNTIVEDQVQLYVSGIPGEGSSWYWYFTGDNSNTDTLVEALRARQKSIVNHNLSLAML